MSDDSEATGEVVNRVLDIAVALPIIAGGILNGAIALAAASPAMALNIFRAERTIRDAR